MAIIMYIMVKNYSIAQARDQLPMLIRAAERGAEIELTRRGERVAVLISVATRERLEDGAANFWDRLVEFRRKHAPSPVPRSALRGLRQRDAGRVVKL